MTTSNWKEYFEKTKDKPPRPLLVRALSFVKDRNDALDLGAGALNDSIFLLKENFKHVTAVDKEPIAQEIADILPKDRFAYVISSFESYDFKDSAFSLVNAGYSLPFTSPSSFDSVFKKIISALEPDGIFVGQLFGDRDEWNKNKKMTFQTLEQAKELFSKMELLSFEEKEQEKATAAGDMKHWHVFHFIARKNAPLLVRF